MPKLLPRDASGAAGAESSGSGVSLGVIIAVVVIGTVFLAVGGGLLCAWIARKNRRHRRQSRRQLEEEKRNKEMSAISMMQDCDDGSLTAEQQRGAGANAVTAAGAAATVNNYSHLGGQPFSDCSSSTCCSLASTRDSLSTMDANFEGSGVTWWWLWRWRRFWHNQRRWFRQQKQRSAVVLGRKGSNSSSSTQSNEIKQQSQHNRCQHDHGHNGHHHHRRGTVDGSPRKLQRRRPKTSIIAATNSLFVPAFLGENDNNANANANHAAGGELSLRAPPPTFTIVRATSLPHRPPPPSEQQRLLPPRGPPNRLPNGTFHGGNPSLMPNMPPRQHSARYHPQQKQQNQQFQSDQMMRLKPPLQQPQPVLARNMPRPPLPALIIPSQPQPHIAPGVPFQPKMMQPQQHQMMILMMRQQQMQQQVQLQQQIHSQHMQQQHQQQIRPSRSVSKHFQTPSTDTALSEILQSTEQRLAQLQGQQPSRGSLRHLSTSSPKKAAADAPSGSDSAASADMESESVKRSSQTSGSDADSMVKGGGDDGRDTSPIADAIPTALSSPSKSPNKNRVAAGTLAVAGSNILAHHPMTFTSPAMVLAQPASTTASSSPGTRSPSSVYSSSGASSRSSLSTVYSVDERSEKGTTSTRTTSKGGVQIANGDDDAHNDRDLAGLGITDNAAHEQFAETTKQPGDLEVALSTTPLTKLQSRSSRRTSVSAAAAPSLPSRSPKRLTEPVSSMPKGSGIMIPHSSSASNLENVFYGDMCHGNISVVPRGNGSNPSTPNRSRHRRNGSLSQQQMQQLSMLMNSGNVRLSFSGGSLQESASSRPDLSHFGKTPAVRVMVSSPSKPDMNSGNKSSNNNHMHGDPADLSDEKTPTSDTSMMDWRSSAKFAVEDTHSLVAGRANPRNSWGSGRMPPHPPKHGRRSLNERIEALQAVQSEDAQFRSSVRPLPRPPSFGSLHKLNGLNNFHAVQQNTNNNLTVVAAAAELRRMNSTAYSESSSCYSNATSATSHATNNTQQNFISTAPSAMGLTQTRRAGRRRNSSAGESATSAAQRNSVVGSRQYLALGKKCVSQVPSTVHGCNKENLDKMNKRSSAPPASSRPTPQRSRSTKSMMTTGTALRRVDENPASGLSTPINGTPNKTTPGGTPSKDSTPLGTAASSRSVGASCSTPRANTGRPLRKSPSRSTQVGCTTAAGSPVAKLRAKSMMMNPSTPTRNSAVGVRQPSSRDSLGLYDEDGFLLSSPARK